jgi:hypothetical protein
LSVIVCRKAAGQYTLGICNNSLAPKPFKIVSYCGPIEKIRELALDQSEKTAVGNLPLGLEKASIGVSDEKQIAGGDVRIFDVQVQEQKIQEIVHSIPSARPRGRALPLRHAKSIKEEILLRPTFFQNFDSVVIDWKYLYCADKQCIEQQSGWLARQKVRIFVDMSSGLNAFPDFRLINNDKKEYDRSIKAIEEVMNRMKILNTGDLILSVHNKPAHKYTPDQAVASFEETLHVICEKAQQRGITVYLRLDPRKLIGNIAQATQFFERVKAPNFKLAASTAVIWDEKLSPQKAKELLAGKVGLWLAAAPEYDVAGRIWSLNGAIAETEYKNQLPGLLGIAPDAPVVLDGIYQNQDQEYNDVKFIGDFSSPNRRP